MKYLIIFILIFGCAPKEFEYDLDCDCGIVLDKGTAQLSDKVCNWLEIENECTGVTKKYCIDNLTTWQLMNNGSRYCNK